MKKILLVLILTIMGNILAAPILQKGKNVNMTKQMMESEKVEIEKVVQRDTQPFFKFIINIGITQFEKEFEKEAQTEFFDKDYILSDSLKSSVLKDFTKGIKKITFKMFNAELKKINYISNNEAEIIYDIKLKDMDKFIIDIGNNEEIEQRVLKKIGYNSKDELERILKKKGNEEIKKKFYNALIEEIINTIDKNLENIKSGEAIVENISNKIKKVNGKWEIEDLENLTSNYQ